MVLDDLLRAKNSSNFERRLERSVDHAWNPIAENLMREHINNVRSICYRITPNHGWEGRV